MSKDFKNKYFIILNKDEIVFICLSNENKISFIKNYNFINGPNNLFREFENFFNNNLIEIEKSLKVFIKKIYIILDTDNSLSVHLSIRYKLETEKINEHRINDLLTYLTNQFTKYSNDQKIIHMTIIKLLIDGMEKDLSLIRETSNNLILEVKFECLKNQILNIIKKLFSNYQISVDKILLANHLRQFAERHTDDIVFLANKFISGEYKNDIMWTRKKMIKKGFFERFFRFFI